MLEWLGPNHPRSEAHRHKATVMSWSPGGHLPCSYVTSPFLLLFDSLVVSAAWFLLGGGGWGLCVGGGVRGGGEGCVGVCVCVCVCVCV